jgi:hypothetical protein
MWSEIQFSNDEDNLCIAFATERNACCELIICMRVVVSADSTVIDKRLS